MKLTKALALGAAFTAGMLLVGVMQSAPANASPAPRLSSPQQAAPNTGANRAQKDEAAVTGELMRVSPEQKSFSVKAASGAEMVFRYDEQTIVTGAETNVAGLATSRGSDVTVSYRKGSSGNMASKIEVHAKK